MFGGAGGANPGDAVLIASISNNTITGFTSNQIHIQGSDGSTTASSASATVTNNTGTVVGSFGAGLLFDIGDGSGVAKNQGCLNASGNNLDGTETTAFFDYDITLQLNETSLASLKVTQASQAALSAANNGNSVRAFANPPNSILYGQASCATP